MKRSPGVIRKRLPPPQRGTWLRERQYFLPGRAPGFEADGLALLGLAVGLLTPDCDLDGASKRWLNGLLDKSLSLRRAPDWNEALIAAAAEALGTFLRIRAYRRRSACCSGE